MLGISLARDVFEGNTTFKNKNDLIAGHRDLDGYLHQLKEYRVRSIELRTLEHNSEQEEYIEVLDKIWERGFNLTVHIRGVEDFNSMSFVDIYPSARYIVENFQRYQDGLILVVHALRDPNATEKELYDRTVKMLRHWSKVIDNDGLPIEIALENNRKKSIIDPGDSTENVLGMVQEVDRSNVGIVWDMGHYYSNLLVGLGLKESPRIHVKELPSDEFLQRVLHTHIHGLDANVTHNPLKEYESLPLELYVQALKDTGYTGIYNLELDSKRFSNQISAYQGIYSSIERLAKSVAN